ncbi:hypothetical protein ATE84_4161 [Aquimarina sp. MAR_2010_214]|uniref:hypothetical protein n=1 Tax=Aquimarina sp. MAR_2010_214 TaxID=1250026 RepID=UPI000C6FDCCF|nr:hypothetical protein [Aquimarina sp. MAR_2010_214]PKV52059.1 hypothetical protein ATE84_4161 [Aquimarina sp. MAR_2010_214]
MKKTIFKITLVMLAIFINSCEADDGTLNTIKSESKNTHSSDNFSKDGRLLKKSTDETIIKALSSVLCPTNDHTEMLISSGRVHTYNYNDSYTYKWKAETEIGITYHETGEYIQLPDIGIYNVTVIVSMPSSLNPVCAEVQRTQAFVYAPEPDEPWTW